MRITKPQRIVEVTKLTGESSMAVQSKAVHTLRNVSHFGLIDLRSDAFWRMPECMDTTHSDDRASFVSDGVPI
jgi:hypothetical protein